MASNFNFITGIIINDDYDLEIYTNWYHEFICIERTEKHDTGEIISTPHIFYGIIPILEFIMDWYNARVISENMMLPVALGIEKNKIVPWFSNDKAWIARIKPNIARKLLKDLKLYNKAYDYKYKIESKCDDIYSGITTYIDIYNASKTYRIVFDFDEEDEAYIIYSITLIENDNDKPST